MCYHVAVLKRDYVFTSHFYISTKKSRTPLRSPVLFLMFFIRCQVLLSFLKKAYAIYALYPKNTR